MEQQDGAGGGPLVVPNWDGYSLARAGRFLYWNPAPTEGMEAFIEGDNITPFLVHRPFRAFKRNPYLRHYAIDDAVDGVAPFFVRRPFKRLGHTPYLWTAVPEAAVAPPEAETHAPFTVRRPFHRLGRTPYLWNTAGDEPPPAPPQAETHATFLVQRPFRQYARRPQLGWSGAVEGAETPPQRNDVGGRVLVVPNWDRFRLARAARFSYWGSGKDDFVAPPPETDKPAHFLVRRAFRPYGRNPYLHHRDWEDGPPPPPVTFNAAWAKGANVLIRAGLVA